MGASAIVLLPRLMRKETAKGRQRRFRHGHGQESVFGGIGRNARQATNGRQVVLETSNVIGERRIACPALKALVVYAGMLLLLLTVISVMMMKVWPVVIVQVSPLGDVSVQGKSSHPNNGWETNPPP